MGRPAGYNAKTVRYVWIGIPAFMILMTTQIAAHVQERIFGFPFPIVWIAFSPAW